MESKKKVILVADYDKQSRLLLDRVLRNAGYATRVVEDGTTIIDLLESDFRCDLIITRFTMHGASAWKIAATMTRLKLEQTPIIFLTGGVSHGYTEALQSTGLKNAHVLTTPFKPQKLLDVVSTLVDP